MTEKEVFKKHDNLSENRLSEESNENVYVKNDVISTVIKHCRGKKRQAKEKQMDLKKKLMIPESKLECPEHKVG